MSTIHRLHFVLRPDDDGNWFVQDDAGHESYGVDKVTGILYDADAIRVYFSPVYAKAGTVQITTDDDWAGSVFANASLGTQLVRIKLRVWPYVRGTDEAINPLEIWDYLVDHPKGAGNLWVNVTMIDAL